MRPERPLRASATTCATWRQALIRRRRFAIDYFVYRVALMLACWLPRWAASMRLCLPPELARIHPACVPASCKGSRCLAPFSIRTPMRPVPAPSPRRQSHRYLCRSDRRGTDDRAAYLGGVDGAKGAARIGGPDSIASCAGRLESQASQALIRIIKPTAGREVKRVEIVYRYER